MEFQGVLHLFYKALEFSALHFSHHRPKLSGVFSLNLGCSHEMSKIMAPTDRLMLGGPMRDEGILTRRGINLYCLKRVVPRGWRSDLDWELTRVCKL